MLVFLKQNIVFFAVPKTGTTSYQAMLRGKADIILRGRPAVKHMNLRKYERSFGPFLDKAFDARPERLAVMREPLEQMRSWYRYRARLPGKDANSTSKLSFDEFIELALLPKPPSVAGIGNQWNFLRGAGDQVGVQHLFAIERPEVLNEFLGHLFGQLGDIPRKNVSPEMPTPLAPERAERFRAARADEYALYDRVMAEGGYLASEIE